MTTALEVLEWCVDAAIAIMVLVVGVVMTIISAQTIWGWWW